jgi:hypothetical protein
MEMGSGDKEKEDLPGGPIFIGTICHCRVFLNTSGKKIMFIFFIPA